MAGTILERADLMLKYFKQSPEGVYPCTEQQAELIKEFWQSLHEYDQGYYYTFNESFNKIIKKRNEKGNEKENLQRIISR